MATIIYPDQLPGRIEAHPVYSDDQIVQMFFATCQRSKYTVRNYTRAINQFRSFIGNKSLKDVTWKEVEVYGGSSLQRQ
ncbi:hypothetical protein O9H85_18880 [Paenibacillus filicis]|uniref:Core-binding (CB) domain-containing protein n=1 Tax=Paenibacillus gyeongsangnamensis TaxID=3388067 RepID=A0ABT4QCD5_9BACL|nr:hypothetical protein [Paenibacillus filicis]MCZ8514446.1 hypothetical protein [Paenibacillus filicis]